MRALPAALMCVFSGAAAQQPSAAVNAPALAKVLDVLDGVEVIVTAQRSAAPASKTPVSMSVLGEATLARAAIDNPAAIGARLPNVHIDGAADGLRITMRGVSNNDTSEKGDPSAAFMLDGIYIARPQSMNVSMFDLARVEVLRGPQGTLYGRNATAGVVNVVSNTPAGQLEGAASIALGNYASRDASAMLNVPVSATLALRAALAYNKHGSYLINGQGTGFGLGLDRDERAARLSARLALGPAAALVLRYDSATQDQNKDSIVPESNFYARDAAGHPVWVGGNANARLTNAFAPPNAPLQQGASRGKTSGLGAQLDWNLGPYSVHYLGSHRHFAHDYRVNYYYRIAPAFAIGVRAGYSGQYRQDSHELRVATAAKGPLTAQAGIYYFREKSDLRADFRDLELLGLPPYYLFHQGPTVAVGKALFGQATWAFTERARLTFGARYSDDGKSRLGSTSFQQGPAFNAATDFSLPNAASLDTHKTTWRLGGEWDLGARTLLYASVSTGYKAGGFNDGCRAGSSADGIACPAVLAVPEAALLYQPETLTSWEAGVKTSFWGNKASLQASAFHYDYANLQLSGVVVISGAPRFTTTNAGQAKVTGFELEGQLRPSAADSISYALALLDAHYDAYLPDGVTSWAGKKLDRAPRASVTFGYEHTFGLQAAQLTAGMFSRTSAAYFISVPSQLLQYRVPRRTQSDISVGYRPQQGAWSLHAHVKNLQNKVAPIAIDSFGMVQPSDPRTCGVRLDYRF
ncbi:TonB-dependent receptor [Massilia sp. TWP1-3-3]|uniref:TonB-dependent receptor n=1 Tax=Massilia sp. TWP1-3-3 TaxID=2804573 RepID=UPI003CEEE103